MVARVLTTTQDQQVAELYKSGLSSIKIAAMFGVCPAAVINSLKRMGVTRRTNRAFNDETETEIVRLYKKGISTIKLGQMYSVCHSTISKVLIRRGVARRARKYFFNEHIFDCLDSPAKHYWLGFCYADAYALPSKSLRVKLKADDYTHLEKLAEFLGHSGPITFHESVLNGKTHQGCLLQVYSRHLANRLNEMGVVKGRSHFSLTKQCLLLGLERHFIRGVLDGDGTIFLTKKGGPVIGFYERPDLLVWLRTYFAENLDTKPNKTITHSPPIAQLCYGGGIQVTRILKYLYKDATVFLERKKIKADEIISRWGHKSHYGEWKQCRLL